MLKTRLNFSHDKGVSVFHCSVSLRWLLLSHLHKYLFKSHPHPVGNLGKWRSDLIFKFEIQNTIVGFIRIFGSIVARFRDFRVLAFIIRVCYFCMLTLSVLA